MHLTDAPPRPPRAAFSFCQAKLADFGLHKRVRTILQSGLALPWAQDICLQVGAVGRGGALGVLWSVEGRVLRGIEGRARGVEGFVEH
jgi:hypothetical protein